MENGTINPEPLNTGTQVPPADLQQPQIHNVEVPVAPSLEPQQKEKSFKKIIIIAIAVIFILTLGFFAYKYLMPTETIETTETPSLTNSLESSMSETTEEREKLEEIVEELKETYPNETPPSLTLDLSETSEPETPQKLAR